MSLILITMPDQSHLLQSSIWAINSVYSYLATIIGRIVSSAYHFKHTHSRTPEPLPPCWVVQLGARVWCLRSTSHFLHPSSCILSAKKKKPNLILVLTSKVERTENPSNCFRQLSNTLNFWCLSKEDAHRVFSAGSLTYPRVNLFQPEACRTAKRAFQPPKTARPPFEIVTPCRNTTAPKSY